MRRRGGTSSSKTPCALRHGSNVTRAIDQVRLEVRRYHIDGILILSAVLRPSSKFSDFNVAALVEWSPVLLGLLVLYIPTYISLANGLWTSEDNIHGPIVFAVVLWAIWQKRGVLIENSHIASPVAGWVLLTFGLALYVVGRSQDLVTLEIGSQIPILSSVLLLFRGKHALRRLWFPLLFLVFMLPLPGFIVDALTGPLKQNISILVENLLYRLDYPIARSGVILSIGPYQLLVADACSGLNSMISLTTMGLLYLYLMKHDSKLRTVILLLLIWPIAFFANMIRVITLVLITFHFGDEAGQGFLHGFAGIALFVTALLILIAFDSLLGFIYPDKPLKRVAV
jgi:exosortase B